MSLAQDAEKTVAALLLKAQQASTADEAIILTDRAMELATRYEIRVRRRFLTGGGVAGHWLFTKDDGRSVRDAAATEQQQATTGFANAAADPPDA